MSFDYATFAETFKTPVELKKPENNEARKKMWDALDEAGEEITRVVAIQNREMREEIHKLRY